MMAQEAHNDTRDSVQALAHQAWDAHVALIRLMHDKPILRTNEAFTALVDTARARFLAAFEVL